MTLSQVLKEAFGRGVNADYSMERSITARGKAAAGFKRVEIPMDEVWIALPDSEPGRSSDARMSVKTYLNAGMESDPRPNSNL
jgi:hypothetical protein